MFDFLLSKKVDLKINTNPITKQTEIIDIPIVIPLFIYFLVSIKKGSVIPSSFLRLRANLSG